MTRYDYVLIDCPRCGVSMDFKSQAGECDYHEYDLDSAPAAVLESIIGQIEICDNCHYHIHIERYKRKQEIVEVV